MAKRVRVDDIPYRPVEAALVRSVVTGPQKAQEAKVLSFPAPEGQAVKQLAAASSRTDTDKLDQLVRVLLSKDYGTKPPQT